MRYLYTRALADGTQLIVTAKPILKGGQSKRNYS